MHVHNYSTDMLIRHQGKSNTYMYKSTYMKKILSGKLCSAI